MHLHASALDFISLAAFLIIFGTIWRTLTAWLADHESPWAGAFAFVY